MIKFLSKVREVGISDSSTWVTSFILATLFTIKYVKGRKTIYLQVFLI
jgi:hypothetical protein